MAFVVDSHVHLGGPDKGDGASLSPTGLIEMMDACDVDKAVVFPFNEEVPGVSFARANDFIAQAIEAFPDRLIGFARLDPLAGEACLLEFERCMECLGLRGVKLHPGAQGFGPDAPVLPGVLEAAGECNAPVVFDNGKPIFPNSAIQDLAGEFGDTVFIMAHMRGEGFIEACLERSNIFLGSVKSDVDSTKFALDRLSVKRIVAGSDSPYAPMKWEMRDKFSGLGLSKGDLSLITGGNILRILG